MQAYTLELKGMTCDSCAKLIRRVAEQNGAAVTSIDWQKHAVHIVCEPEKLDLLKQQLAEKGYPENGKDAGSRGNPERAMKYLSAILAGESQVFVESRLMNYAFGSTILVVLLTAVAYSATAFGVENPRAYVPLFLLAIVGSIAMVFSYYHMRCYRESLSCTNGMMVGMTMGMVTGFLSGALIGATNGMFLGSTAGLILGMGIGANLGRSCGVMGAMEGVMAGLMGGIMGAMTSLMMLRDNLLLFLYILFGVCTFILVGLSYLLYRESGSAPRDGFRLQFQEFLVVSMVFSASLMFLMLYGPKGPIVYP